MIEGKDCSAKWSADQFGCYLELVDQRPHYVGYGRAMIGGAGNEAERASSIYSNLERLTGPDLDARIRGLIDWQKHRN